MTSAEYYGFPEGTNLSILYLPHYLEDKPNFHCPSSMLNAFYYYGGEYIPPLDTSEVTTMSNMFSNCQNLTSLDSSTWDTSKVTTMNYMFTNCRNLSEIKGIESWDTSKVTTMGNMFESCQNLTSLDSSNWDTSKVTTMSYMFSNCHNLSEIKGIESWDTSKVTTMDYMFNNCKKLSTLSTIKADNLKFSSYSSPFGTSDNTILYSWGGFINLKNSWNGTYCVNKLTALSHQSLVNIINGLYDFVGNGVTPTSSQGIIKFGSTHLARLTEEEIAIATNKGWTLT